MIKIEEPKRDIELEFLEAEVDLAVMQYENEKWLHKDDKKSEVKYNGNNP
jgi:hypothetical protein